MFKPIIKVHSSCSETPKKALTQVPAYSEYINSKIFTHFVAFITSEVSLLFNSMTGVYSYLAMHAPETQIRARLLCALDFGVEQLKLGKHWLYKANVLHNTFEALLVSIKSKRIHVRPA